MNSDGCKNCKLNKLVQVTSEKRRAALESELEKTKKLLEQQQELSIKLRKDFLREATNLREIIQAQQSDDKSLVSKMRTSLVVKFFDDTEGLDPNVCELLNARLNQMKREQEEVIGKKEALIGEMKKRIEVMDKLQTETYALMNIPITTIFQGVAAIHPHAYPVFKAFIEAYPRDHFRACMKEALANGQKSGIISKFREVKYRAEIQQCIALCEQKISETIEYYKKKFEWAEDIKQTNRENLIREREIHEAELNKITLLANQNAKKMIEQEQIRQSVYFETKYAAQIQERAQILRELQKFQETAKQGEKKFAFQKWLMITRFERFMFQTMNIPEERYELYRSQARAEILGHHEALLKLSNCYNLELNRSEDLRNTCLRLEKRIVELRGELEGEKTRNIILQARVETKTAEIQILQKYADNSSKSQMIAELQLRSYKKETEEVVELLKFQKSVRENYEVRFGLGPPKDPFGKDGFALLAQEQDENELEILFQMLRSDLVAVQAKMTLNIAKQQLSLIGGQAKKKIDNLTQTELTCVQRQIILQDADYERPASDGKEVECQTELRANLIEYAFQSSLQLSKLINEGLLAFKKPPNVDLEIIEGAITSLTERGLESQGADIIQIDFVGLANAIAEAKNWSKSKDKTTKVNVSSRKNLPPQKISAAEENQEDQSPTQSQKNKEEELPGEDILQELKNQMSETALSKSSDGKIKLTINRVDQAAIDRQNRERQMAETTFEAYVELLAVIEKLDPNLFRAAVQTLKGSLTQAIDFTKTSYLMKNFPEKIPDVFLRLWETRQEPKTQIHRHELVQKARLELQKSLASQGLISEFSNEQLELTHKVSIKSQSPELRTQQKFAHQTSVLKADVTGLDNAQNTRDQLMSKQNRVKTAGGARNYRRAISTLKRLANQQLQDSNQQIMSQGQSTFAMRSSQDFGLRNQNVTHRKSFDLNSNQSHIFLPKNRNETHPTSALSFPSTAKASNLTQSNNFFSQPQKKHELQRNIFVLSQESTTELGKSSILSPKQSPDETYRRQSVPLFHAANYKTSQLFNL